MDENDAGRVGAAPAEAPSLVSWFTQYVEQHAADPLRAPVPQAIVQLLRTAFPVLFEDVAAPRLANDGRRDEWGACVALLEAFYEGPLGIDVAALGDALTIEGIATHLPLLELLELVLCAVVQCQDKAQFVRDIMAMEDAVQVDIMSVIERVMSKTANLSSNGATSMASDDGERALDAHEKARETEARQTPSRDRQALTPSRSRGLHQGSPAARSPLHLARNAEMERLKRENAILREENVHVSGELQALTGRYDQLEHDNETLLKNIEEMNIQSERDLLKKERTVRTLFDDRIHTLQRELDCALSELEAKAAVAREAAELRDEVDLLRPAADRLAKAESTLAKYKTKIEELSNVKEKLRRTEEANTDLVEKNLALEGQVAKTASIQRKLTDSKEALTAAQFRVSELETQLSRVSAELDAKRATNESTEQALREAEMLNQQLQRTAEQHTEEDKCRPSMGNVVAAANDIGELSPELMEKIARLEHENKSMRAQVDGTTSERIEQLMDEIDDLSRLKSSFETKYFETDELLKATRVSLEQMQTLAEELESNLQTGKADVVALSTERDGLLVQLSTAEDEIRELQTVRTELEGDVDACHKRETCLKEIVEARESEIDCLRQDHDDISRQLRVCAEHLACVQEDVWAHAVERRLLLTQREQLSCQVQEITKQCEKKQAAIADLEESCQTLQNDLLHARNSATRWREEFEASAMLAEEKIVHIQVLGECIHTLRTEVAHLCSSETKLIGQINEQISLSQHKDSAIARLHDQLLMSEEDNVMILGIREARESELRVVLREKLIVDAKLQEANELKLMIDEDNLQRFILFEGSMDSRIRSVEEELVRAQQAADVEKRSLLCEHEDLVERLKQEQADTILRMTNIIDDKCSTIETIKHGAEVTRLHFESQIAELNLQSQESISALLHERDELSAKHDEYVLTHSYPNDEVNSTKNALQTNCTNTSKELDNARIKFQQQKETLMDQIRKLQDAMRNMKNRFEGQEVKLRETIQGQLDANRRLVEANQVVKNELMQKDARASQLENTVTRLESRVMFLEKERSHFSSKDGRTRDDSDEFTSTSTEFNSHVAKLMEDYEQLQSDYLKLQQSPSRCAACTETQGEAASKSYYHERLKQVELEKSQESIKRRELLLVNAKLIQDQKQLHLKSQSTQQEILQLKEKMQVYMLRDERRKKEHDQLCREAEILRAENESLRVELRPSTTGTVGGESSAQHVQEPDMQCQENQENIPPAAHSSQSPPSAKKKRKIEQVQPSRPISAEDDNSECLTNISDDSSVGVASMRAPTAGQSQNRSKRRLTHFMAKQSDHTTPEENPSECQQQ